MRILRILLSRINKMWLLMGAAVLLGLAATWVTTQYLKNRELRIEAEAQKRATGGATVAVVVPVRNLDKGVTVDSNVMAAREILADLVYDETVLATDFGKVEGLKLARPVEQGKPLRRSDIEIRAKGFSETLPEGTRAITIDIDEINSIAQMVRVGNRVDLMLLVTDANDPTGGQQVVSLMQKVKVIATGQTTVRVGTAAPAPGAPGAQAAAAQRYTNLTLEVTPEEAARIALAQQMGKIRAVLRNEEDQAVASLGKVSTQTVMRGYVQAKGGKEKSEGEAPVVEYIIGGKSAGSGASTPQNITVNMPGMAAPPAAGAAPAGAAAGTTSSVSIPGMGNIPYPSPYGGSPTSLSAAGAKQP